MPEPTVRNTNQQAFTSESISQSANCRNVTPEPAAENANQRSTASSMMEETVSQRRTEHRENENLRKAGSELYNIAFWIFSLINLLFSLPAFSKSGIMSGILFYCETKTSG